MVPNSLWTFRWYASAFSTCRRLLEMDNNKNALGKLVGLRRCSSPLEKFATKLTGLRKIRCSSMRTQARATNRMRVHSSIPDFIVSPLPDGVYIVKSHVICSDYISWIWYCVKYSHRLSHIALSAKERQLRLIAKNYSDVIRISDSIHNFHVILLLICWLEPLNLQALSEI